MLITFINLSQVLGYKVFILWKQGFKQLIYRRRRRDRRLRPRRERRYFRAPALPRTAAAFRAAATRDALWRFIAFIAAAARRENRERLRFGRYDRTRRRRDGRDRRRDDRDRRERDRDRRERDRDRRDRDRRERDRDRRERDRRERDRDRRERDRDRRDDRPRRRRRDLGMVGNPLDL